MRSDFEDANCQCYLVLVRVIDYLDAVSFVEVGDDFSGRYELVVNLDYHSGFLSLFRHLLHTGAYLTSRESPFLSIHL